MNTYMNISHTHTHTGDMEESGHDANEKERLTKITFYFMVLSKNFYKFHKHKNENKI